MQTISSRCERVWHGHLLLCAVCVNKKMRKISCYDSLYCLEFICESGESETGALYLTHQEEAEEMYAPGDKLQIWGFAFLLWGNVVNHWRLTVRNTFHAHPSNIHQATLLKAQTVKLIVAKWLIERVRGLHPSWTIKVYTYLGNTPNSWLSHLLQYKTESPAELNQNVISFALNTKKVKMFALIMVLIKSQDCWCSSWGIFVPNIHGNPSSSPTTDCTGEKVKGSPKSLGNHLGTLIMCTNVIF